MQKEEKLSILGVFLLCLGCGKDKSIDESDSLTPFVTIQEYDSSENKGERSVLGEAIKSGRITLPSP